MKKNIIAAVFLCLALSTFSAARVSNGAAAVENPPAMPRIFANARFVYVASYDGDQFDPRLLPDDRAAIARVQEAIEKWGKLIVVYRPQAADVILMVQSRPSEDVLAVYDAHNGDERSGPSPTYLWRVMGRGGLQTGEMPLFSEFETAWDKSAH
jgi:hypothetical protein